MKGILDIESPALLAILKRHFDVPEIKFICEVYRYASLNGAGVENQLLRKDDKFNPRPARLASIIIKDQKIIDSEIIAGTFLYCLPKVPTVISDNYKSLLNSIANLDQSSNKFCIIYLADLLDEIRHSLLLAQKPNKEYYIKKLDHLINKQNGISNDYKEIQKKIDIAMRMYLKYSFYENLTKDSCN